MRSAPGDTSAAGESDGVEGSPGGVTVLADGTPFSQMAHYQPSGSNGWSFGIGSVMIGGSLRVDATLQKIVKNVIRHAGVDGG